MQPDVPTAQPLARIERGYVVTALAEYLTTAHAHGDELRRDLAHAAARRSRADAMAAAMAGERGRLSALWLEAQEQAEAIRHAAEDQAMCIIRAAREAAAPTERPAGVPT